MADHSVSGRCVGGPLDGQQVTVRSEPFLAADKAAAKAWIYKGQPDDTFTVCTDHDDSLDYPHGAATGQRSIDWDRLWAAGEQSAIDVVAVDEGR